MLFRFVSILILAGLLMVGVVLASVAILVGAVALAGFLLRLWWRSRSGTRPVAPGHGAGPEIIEGEFTVEQGGALPEPEPKAFTKGTSEIVLREPRLHENAQMRGTRRRS